MRTWWVLALVGALGPVAACGGSSIERHEGRGASAGDGDGGTSSGGTGGTSASGTSGTNTGGTSAGGTGAGGSSGVGGAPDPCADVSCGSFCGYCTPNDLQCNGATGEKFCDAEGRCNPSQPTCPEPTCTSAIQCPYPKSLCLTCGNGETMCATRTCVDGVCGLARPVCPECRTDADCPLLPIECETCDDGTTSCPSFECHGGQCLTRFDCNDPCAGRACGEACNPCTGSDCPLTEHFTCNLRGACGGANPACMGNCETASDCPTPPPDCIECLDSSCAQMACINGLCELLCDRRQPCDAVSDCEPTLECVICPDESCGERACIDGGCHRLCPFAP
jgi:hypothetical protein